MKSSETFSILLFVLLINLFCFAQQPKTNVKTASPVKTPAKAVMPAGSKTAGKVVKPKMVLISFLDAESGLYGFKDSISDKVIVEAKYTYVKPFSCAMAAVNIGGEMNYDYDYEAYFIGGKWGFINSNGVLVVPLKYDDVRDFSEGMAAVNVGGITEYDEEYDESYFSGGKWGFINSSGVVVVPVKYDDVQSFSGGFANVSISGSTGCVSKSGQMVIPLKYSGIMSVHKGIAVVWNTNSNYESKYGLVNTKGISITPLIYDELEFTEDGLYKAKKNELSGLINSAGKTIVPFKYEKIETSEGFSIITVNGLLGLLDKTGNEVYPPVNSYISTFDEDGFMIIRKNEDHFSYFHKSGLKFDQKYDFEGVVARVVLNGRYGLIDKKAKFILPYKYDNIGYFSDTLAIAKLNGKQGYVSKSGKEVIPCIYDNIGSVKNNFIWVKLGTKQGYINIQGKVIVPIKYDETYENYPGLDIHKVKLNDKLGIINMTLGANYEIIPPKFDYIYDYGGDVLKSNIGGVKNAEGYASGGKWGIIDKQSGREVVETKYNYIWGYTDGLALVIVGGVYDPDKKSYSGGKYGFINSKGEETIPIQFDVANPFQNGVAWVTINSASYKINTRGERVN